VFHIRIQFHQRFWKFWSETRPCEHGFVGLSSHASDGPRDEEPRHLPSTDAAAGGISESWEAPRQNSLRGVNTTVDHHLNSDVAARDSRATERERIEKGKGSRERHEHPPVLPKISSCVFPLADSFASAPRRRNSACQCSFRFLSTKSVKQLVLVTDVREKFRGLGCDFLSPCHETTGRPAQDLKRSMGDQVWTPCHPGAGGRAVDESKAAPFCCRCCRCCHIKGTERRFRRAHAPTEQVKRRKACTSREAEFLRMSTYRKDQPLPKTNFDLLVHKMLGAENQILFMLLIRIYYIAHAIRGSCVSLCAYLVFYLSACCNIRNI
jgi:hypothetical protein